MCDRTRAGMAIGRDVYSCHPPKIEMMVRSIIGDFKSGARDKVSVWMEKEGILKNKIICTSDITK